MAKSRAQQLYEVGRQAYRGASGYDPGLDSHALLAAVANMLAVATAPKQKKSSGPTFEDKKTGERLYNLLREKCPHALAYEPVRTHTFGAAGKRIREANITEGDIRALIQWLKSDALSWRDTKPTWSECVRKLEDWVATARSSAPASNSDHLQSMRDEGKL